MTTSAALNYRCFLGGASQAQIAALLGEVPLPLDVFSVYGCRVVSDTTISASPVVRAIVLGLGPSSTATVVAHLVPGDGSGSPIESVTVSGAGAGYVRPPQVVFSGGRPAGISPSMIGPPDNNAPANAVSYLKVVGAAVTAPGVGYSAATTATLVGALKQDGIPGTVSLTIVAGNITAATVTAVGDGYTSVPQVIVTDPMGTGSGGVVDVSMGVGRVSVLRGGGGYTIAPTITLLPWFHSLFPDGSDQAAPFRNLMRSVLGLSVSSPVSADEPLIA